MSDAHEKQNQYNLKELILLAKSGNEKAFEEVYKTYYTPLFRYIYSRMKDRSEAEDITQNVFLKIWNAISNWDEAHTSPLSFFFTVARNTLIDHFRKNSHKEIVSNEIILKFAEENGSSDKETTDSETKEKLLIAIRQLSADQQEIITLFYTNDLSYKEISEIINKKEDAIRQIHSRAIKKLRQIYKA